MISYRLVEINDSAEWVPIGVAVPYEGQVAVFTLGKDVVRQIEVKRVEDLEMHHLWADRLRWGSVHTTTEERASDPWQLLLEVATGKKLTPRDLTLDLMQQHAATWEEVARLKTPIATTPEQALRALKLGNGRFFSGEPAVTHLSPLERRAQSLSQSPFAVIIGCSDSRVPIEIVFDQGPGNLFIVRVAGNVMGANTLGSIEYGVCHLKSRLVVVMGHEGCGAVQAALLPAEVRDREPGNIQTILNKIVPSVESLPPIRDRKARMREAVINNVRQQVHVLRQNQAIREATARGQITVVGAFYSITSGAVDFLESEEDLAVHSEAAQTAARN